MGFGTHIRQHVAARASVTAALDWSRGWGERAQERARRNAMVATNDLLARRREHEDVDEFLLHAHARRQTAAGHHHRVGHRPSWPACAEPVAPPAASALPSEQLPTAAQG